jgi:hypothetical protein
MHMAGQRPGLIELDGDVAVEKEALVDLAAEDSNVYRLIIA